MKTETEKCILEDLLSSVLSHSKEIYPCGNPKFNDLGIFQSLKLRNLLGKILRISLKLNFTPNTLGCYGLMNDDLYGVFLLKLFTHCNTCGKGIP